MSAQVIYLPVIARPAFHDPAWREQYERQCRAQCETLIAPPPRTRPIIVVDQARSAPSWGQLVTRENFEAMLQAIAAELEDEG